MARERTVSELLHEVFRRGGLLRGVQRAEAVLLWPQVVGPDVARFSSAVALVSGTLIVDVPDPETAMHLGMQRHHVLAAYRDRLGHGGVRELRFRVGRSPQPGPPEPPPPPVPVDPDAVAALARSVQDLDGELAGAALQAGKALLSLQARRRAGGGRPCSVCGVVCEPGESHRSAEEAATAGWCPICRRLAREPKVRRAAERLSVLPHDSCPVLSSEERAVAVRLSLRRLRHLALELLPQALGDPATRPLLERVARSAAVLHHGLPPGDVPRDRYRGALDDRVVRALGAWRPGA